MEINQLTVTTVLGWVRESTTILFLVGLIWAARGFFEDAKTFIKDIRKFMEVMTTFAETVVNNHLKHIERDLAFAVKVLKEESGEDTLDYETRFAADSGVDIQRL